MTSDNAVELKVAPAMLMHRLGRTISCHRSWCEIVPVRLHAKSVERQDVRQNLNTPNLQHCNGNTVQLLCIAGSSSSCWRSAVTPFQGAAPLQGLWASACTHSGTASP